MKALFCEDCRDLVRPITGRPGEPRFCICGRHAIWGMDDSNQSVRVFDRCGDRGVPDKPAAYLVLLSNHLMEMDGPMRETTARALLAAQKDGGFNYYGSLVVRLRPEDHPKTEWSDLSERSARWSTFRAGEAPPPSQY